MDVSNNNGRVDWRQVARHSSTSGITGAIMKATEGTAFTDELFHDARGAAERAGIRVGAYHFARPDLNPGPTGAAAEARHFAKAVGTIEPGEWRPMLDYEHTPFTAEWVHAWNQAIVKLLGVAPLFYSYLAAIEGMGLTKPLGDGLVIAYPNGLPRSAPVPHPWKHWTAHQYAWHGRVNGVSGDCDLNWTPAVWTMLAHPVRGAALEPMYARRRRQA